jgi:uncharacterized protein (DUF4415 family)
MKKVISRKLTPKQAAEIRALAKLAEKDIDTKSIPEVRDWRGAKRGVFFRPVKQQLTLRLDADVVAWFKERAGGKGYQTVINEALRAHVGQRSARRRAT